MTIGNMTLAKHPVFRFLPAVLMMLAIFLFSSGQAVDTPDRLLRMLVNKGGHMIGYGILALAFWRALEFKGSRWWVAWLLAVLYALTDEYHQSLVPGRHPSLFDVFFFDNLGALLTLWLTAYLYKLKQPGGFLVVEEEALVAKQ